MRIALNHIDAQPEAGEHYDSFILLDDAGEQVAAGHLEAGDDSLLVQGLRIGGVSFVVDEVGR